MYTYNIPSLANVSVYYKGGSLENNQQWEGKSPANLLWYIYSSLHLYVIHRDHSLWHEFTTYLIRTVHHRLSLDSHAGCSYSNMCGMVSDTKVFKGQVHALTYVYMPWFKGTDILRSHTCTQVLITWLTNLCVNLPLYAKHLFYQALPLALMT